MTTLVLNVKLVFGIVNEEFSPHTFISYSWHPFNKVTDNLLVNNSDLLSVFTSNKYFNGFTNPLNILFIRCTGCGGTWRYGVFFISLSLSFMYLTVSTIYIWFKWDFSFCFVFPYSVRTVSEVCRLRNKKTVRSRTRECWGEGVFLRGLLFWSG